MHRSGGFTLLEAALTLVITGTVLATAVGGLRDLRAPYAMRTATGQLAADLAAARMRAIARNTRHRVRFLSAGSWVIERETAANAFAPDGGVTRLPAGVSIGQVTPQDPIFDTRGMLAATTRIPVSIPGAGSRTVMVNVLGNATID